MTFLYKLLLVATVGVSIIDGACYEDQFYQCADTFVQYSTQAQVGYTWTEDDLEDVCQSFVDVAECTDFINTCWTQVNAWLGGVQEAFDYLCYQQGEEIYLRHQACLVEPQLNLHLSNCNRTYTEDYSAARSAPREDILRDSCRAMNKFVDCGVGHVSESCGTEAAGFQYKIMSGLVLGAARQMSCELDQPDLREPPTPEPDAGCDRAAYLQCMKKFLPYSEETGGQMPLNAQLEDICRVYDAVAVCVAPTTVSCDSTSQTQKDWDDTKEAYDHLCQFIGESSGTESGQDPGGQEQECIGQFQCLVGGECVRTSQQCDGSRDCVDGSDEAFCTTSGGCDLLGYIECFTPIQPYAEELQVGISWTPDELEEICGVFADLAECGKPKMASCNREAAGVWTSVEDAFIFLCEGPGKSAYLKNQACLANPSLESKQLACSQTLTEEQEIAAQESDVSLQVIQERSCKAINWYVGCTVGNTKEECGRDAAEFYHTLLLDLFAGSLDVIACDVIVTVDNAEPGGAPSNGAPSNGEPGGSPINKAATLTRGSMFMILGLLLMPVILTL